MSYRELDTIRSVLKKADRQITQSRKENLLLDRISTIKTIQDAIVAKGKHTITLSELDDMIESLQNGYKL
jgi:hypothetical protein